MSNHNNTNNEAGSAAQSKPSGVALLASLRRSMPLRRMTYWEHWKIAERQASRLLDLLHQTEPGVSLDWLSGNTLGNITVVVKPRWQMEDLPKWEGLSGFSKLTDGHWIIGINKSNPHARRRFTLAHEFKHVLDGSRAKVTHQGLTHDQCEHICDYFAACYLRPGSMLRKAWTSGVQDVEALAGLFKVSKQAMRTRLGYLQYIDNEAERPTTSYFRRELNRLDEFFGTAGAEAA